MLRSATTLFLAVAVVAGVLLVSGAGPVVACNPGRPSYAYAGFSGTQRNVTSVYGVRTRIETYDPHIQGTARAWAWNMLTRPGLPSGQQFWAQVGWSKRPTSGGFATWSSFISWTDNAGHYWVIDHDYVAPGSSHTYYTYFLPGTAQFNFFMDSTAYGPKTGNWIPSNVQIYGETHNRNTQMPGDTSNKVLMDNAYYIVTGETTWRAMASSAGANDSSIYGATKNSNTSYSIWDKDCSSSGG